MFRPTLHCLLIICAVSTSAPTSVRAAEQPRLLATHGRWSAYVFTENNRKICYMLSQPDHQDGAYTRRGQVYALITDRPADSSKNVFSYMAGYPYKAGSDVTVKIDGDSFTLFTQDDTAWAPDAATDEKIARAMARGSDMTVKGTSSRGPATTDTFSLTGSSAAHQAMAKECSGK